MVQSMMRRRRRAQRERRRRGDLDPRDRWMEMVSWTGFWLCVPGALTIGNKGFENLLSPAGSAVAIIGGLILIVGGTRRPTTTLTTDTMATAKAKAPMNREVKTGEASTDFNGLQPMKLRPRKGGRSTTCPSADGHVFHHRQVVNIATHPRWGGVDGPREFKMNQDQVKGNWDQLKGKAKRVWGELTDDDFMKAEGSADKLYGLIQVRFGESKASIKEKIDKIKLS